MARTVSAIRIPIGSSALTGVARMVASARGLIVVASAGANDSYATWPNGIGPALERRGYATVTVNLLTEIEEGQDRAVGCYHMDVPFLESRLGLVLGHLRSRPELRALRLGLFVEGMAAAAAAGCVLDHKEVRAIVSWNGRADLAEKKLSAVGTPLLFLTTPTEPHVTDLNRKAVALLSTFHALCEVDGPGPERDRLIAARAADWFDAHLTPVRGGTNMIALNNILVATDFSEPAQVALQYGVELAKRFDARLHVLHVVDDLAAHPYTAIPGAEDIGQLQTELESDARANLDAALASSDRAATRAQLDIVVSPSAADAILGYARDRHIGLIIVGTHGRRGLARVLLGSVARHVSGVAECPVLTVRAHEHDFVGPDVERAVTEVGPAV